MLLDLHLVIVLCTISSVLFSDGLALLWILGKIERLSPRLIVGAHYTVTGGLALIIITGGLLYARAPDAYLTDSTFIAKMIAVSALIANTYFMGRLSPLAVEGPYTRLQKKQQIQLLLSGGVSVLGWATAALCGYLLS